ncbi:hypothetical protein ACFMQL_00695 [Nonomuraea fastidiosa]|jgi:hypothetical protein|uniref:hypothetical protein n=1 Tax=Nonomuraea TaxID=83681 RepID=UPI00343DA5E1
MTYGSESMRVVTADLAESTRWTCLMCDGVEESAPDAEPPSPPICPACIRLALVQALRALGVEL